MKTTLRELKNIEDFNYNKLISNLDTDNLDIEVTVLQVLDSNGIQDAVYALKTQDYKNYCLFLADVVESVLHLFEEKYPNDQRPRKCIEGIRLWYDGKITDEELDELRKDAYFAARAASAATGATAWTASAAWSAAGYVATGYVAASVVRAVDAASSATRDKKWKEIETILRKYIDKDLLDDNLFVI